MSDSIGDILNKQKRQSEPREFPVIRQFILDRYQEEHKLSMSNKNIIISVPNSALAGSLQMELHKLSELCQTEKRLILRVS